MKTMLKSKKSQALVEMGILGSLILLALGTMCIFIARMNADQYILMESFRRALKKSHDTNELIAYGMWDDRRQVDVNMPIIGSRLEHSGAAYVHWAVPSVEDEGEDPESSLYVAINSPPAMMFMNEYKVEEGGGGIQTDYFTTTFENLNVQTSGSSTTSVRSAGVGEVMHYKIGDSMSVMQGRGYGGARALGGSN